MSLFDVIRYPISFPPTAEQIEALPDDIFRKWVVFIVNAPNSGVCTDDRTSRKETISWFVKLHDSANDMKYIGPLRKIIEEHDNELV